jgi:hypothetical protein
VISPAFRERRLYAKMKTATQNAMMDREEGTTKYANGAKRLKIVVLAADGRRPTQTFSSADPAEESRLALRAGEMSRARRSAGELRMVFNRDWSHETKQ